MITETDEMLNIFIDTTFISKIYEIFLYLIFITDLDLNFNQFFFYSCYEYYL